MSNQLFSKGKVIKTTPTYQWKLVARDIGEVVVLHVVADVEGNVVEWAIVGVCLVTLLVEVMLGDKVSGQGMQSHGQDGSYDEVHVGLEAEEVDDGCVEYNLHYQVNDLQFTGCLEYKNHRYTI